jgi:hypothetical protein
MHVKIIGNHNFHHDSSTIATKRCRCRYRHGQNGYACSPPLLGHRRDAPLILSPHSITDTPEIPLRPMTNVHTDANAKHARRCGHGHAARLCWTPQTNARSFPSPPYSPSTHLYMPERRDTSFLYIAPVRVRHCQSKCWGHRQCPRPFLLFFAWLNVSSSYLSNASGLASYSSLWMSISSRHPAGHLLRAIAVELHLKI